MAPFETTSYSNDTPEGAAAILLREMQWAALQAASMNGTLDALTRALPTDPYFPNPTDPTQEGQWHLLNNGQQVGNPDYQFIYGVPGEDINVVPAWNLGYTGEGVIVAILDDGVQSYHPDLLGNMHPDFAFNAFDGTNNASPFLLIPSHGTAVAGLIGATWSLESGESIGGVGVAPGVTMVPINMLQGSGSYNGRDPVVNAFRYALMVGADVTNNSWGPPDNRTISTLSPEILQALRDSVLFGRDGLGMINVFASGNGGTNLDSATYDPYISSRYTIGVGGVDHDGLYANADGTVTSYPEAGANVLVVAPTGSNGTDNIIANDDGLGSGLWTTDLTGDNGYNAAPDNMGIDDDRDFLEDTSYTTRFNGTSGSAPLVTGVIALMLEANPNLTYRDVQEILVRSARQNAQFEIASSGGGSQGAGFEAEYSTWQTNQMIPFRDPDSWQDGNSRFDSIYDPIANPTLTDFPRTTFTWPAAPGLGNDLGRINGHYELQPAEFTNGAGYTVSQGYGVYAESLGYAHGTIDAELAVIMARDWHTLNQDIPKQTEKTFSTFIGPGGLDLPAAEVGGDPSGNILVPGGIGGEAGFIAFWDEYFADPPAPFDPANADSWPENTRGASYIDFTVPLNQQMNVEWVEVKISLDGDPEGLDFVKINMTSPNGMQSELNHYYADASLGGSLQFLSEPATGWFVSTGGTLTDSNQFVWTFSTNRNWGESTNSAVIMDALTGEPVAGSGFGNVPQPIFRDWELHIENWSATPFVIAGIEVVWHGKPISGGRLDQDWLAEGYNVPVAQRIQGIIGIDVDSDDEFSGIDDSDDNEWNNRYIQTAFNTTPGTLRQTELQRRLLDDYQDNNENGIFDEGDVREQEPYAENVLVEAYEFTVVNGVDVVDDQPIAQFLTGADGNYYFDLLPGNYMIRVNQAHNPSHGTLIDDPNTPSQYLQHYKDEWRITEDWFYAPDREDPTANGNPGEIHYDAAAQAPIAFQFDVSQPRIPMAVQNINFLYKPLEIPANNVVVSGIVYADVNENGSVDIFDSPAGGMRVYVDSERNGQFDPEEQWVYTNPDGTYELTVLASTPSVIAIGVDLEAGWEPSLVGGDVKTLFAGPGDVIENTNFFLNPPDDSPGSGLGNITGFVFSDLDPPGEDGPNGVRDLNEVGLAGVRVFLDADADGVYDPTEISAITAPNGGYFFANVAPGTHRIDVQIDNEGTAAATAQMTTPVAGYHNVTISAGQTRTGIVFGLYNLAGKDYGDLPASYNAGGVPSHILAPHFRLGTTIDGEVAGQASGADDTTDDGVVVLGDGLLHAGANTLQVTVYGVGGFLSGWIDWNDSGTFEENERLSFTDANTGEVLGTQADLGPGTFNLIIQAPALVDGTSAARFRWGEFGLNLGSQSFIGEVEDYFLQTSSMIVTPSLPGDFNEDGGVNAADYVLFRKVLGTGASLPNSTNPSGPVVAEDGALWTNNFAESSTVVAPSLPGDFNDDGGVNAADYVAFRKLLGTGGSLPNTTNPAGPVVAADEALWSSNYGETDGGGGGGGAASQYVEAPSAGSSSTPVVARGASSGSPSTSAVVSTPQTNSTDSQAADSSTSSPFFAGLSFDISPAVSFKFVTEDAQSDSAASDEQSNAEILLLLDQALEELDERDDDAPLTDRSSEEDGYSDLALAAVFDDNTSWWSL